MHTYDGAKANLDQMQHSALESKSNAVFLAFRRRERGELGPAISSLEVRKKKTIMYLRGTLVCIRSN